MIFLLIAGNLINQVCLFNKPVDLCGVDNRPLILTKTLIWVVVVPRSGSRLISLSSISVLAFARS